VSCSTHPLLPGRAEDGGGGTEDSPAGFLPWEAPASGCQLARSSLNLRSASKRARHPSSSKSHEEDASASPPVG
jgi:hypothetical protein